MKNFLTLALQLVCSFCFAENLTKIGLPPGVKEPHGFCTFNGLLWFGAVQDGHTVQLYKSDGSPSGTEALPQAFPGSLENLTAINGNMYFTTSNDMWYTNGSKLSHLHAFTGLATPFRIFNFKQYKNYLIFLVTNDGPAGNELYALDLQQHTLSTVSALTGKGFSETREYTIFNNKVYFPAGPGHSELWVSDLTNGGTHMVVDLNPTGSSDPSNLTVYDNRLYFSAEEDPYKSGGPHKYKPWSTDGTDTGTHLLKAITPTSIYRITFANAGNKLIFNAQDWNHVMTYTSDGTAAGTDTLKTTLNLDHHSFYKGYLYCRGSLSNSLWRSDGTDNGSTEVVNFIHLIAPQAFVAYNNKLYFKGTAPGVNAFHLWSTDGSNSKQHVFPAIHNSPLHFTNEFYEYNSGLYFSAEYDTSGYTLWRLDPFPTSIKTTAEQKTVRLYPNPARGQVTLSMPGEFAGKTVKVDMRNMTGQRIASLHDGIYTSHLELALPPVAAGLYVIEVFAAGQPMACQQLAIHR